MVEIDAIGCVELVLIQRFQQHLMCEIWYQQVQSQMHFKL